MRRVDEFESRAREAVRKRLISDVPLGLFLSGGVDSTYVLAQMIAAGARDVQTFAIGFADIRYDEREHARRIADRLGSTHHEAVVNPTDLVEIVAQPGPALRRAVRRRLCGPHLLHRALGQAADHGGADRRRRR